MQKDNKPQINEKKKQAPMKQTEIEEKMKEFKIPEI